MRGMRQLAASQDAAALGPVASAMAFVTCLAIASLFCATSNISYLPGMSRQAFKNNVHETLVRMTVS